MFGPASGISLTVTPAGTGTGTVTSSPAGINCGTVCTANFDSGTLVTLTATPSSGSTFTGWGGACSGSSTCSLTLTAAESVIATFTAGNVTLMVTNTGTGSGTVTSSPTGIDCGQTCSASFASGTSVTLTATPDSGSVFGGWTGACTGTSTCTLTLTSTQAVTATFNLAGTIQSINHIIFFLQENRSFDHYFGELRQYWADNGYPDQDFDGLPQFNNPPGPIPTNPGCDPALPPPSDCTIDSASPQVQSYHLSTQCVENPSPSWNESHADWNVTDPVNPTPTLDGFVWTAAHDGRNMVPPYFDVDGLRAIGYYDGDDLNYYYFMASNFATSDRWFNPVMSRTALNRMYLIGGTSGGHAYPLNTSGSPQLDVLTIFEALQDAGISWKIYVHADPTGCVDAKTCLYPQSYIQNFIYGNVILQNPDLLANVESTDQFLTDAANGTLPQVAMIEPASEVSLDEHPSDNDVASPPRIQAGAAYAASLINGLMAGPNWKDSALIFAFDEFGGFYDHVAPQPAVSPDGIMPSDLLPGDICTQSTGPTCDFTYTGYRVPLIVVSPFAKKNYVSHTVADYTAILKFIETRFGLASLTKRDAAQIDMTEFFDFSNPPWLTPPTPPTQNQSDACYLDHLP